MGDQVKLLGARYGPFSIRVQIALELKGVDYEFVEEDLNNKSRLLLQSNPVHKKIPVLIHNANSISESLIILQYIDETWAGGQTLLPKHPYHRALSRFWASFVDDKVTRYPTVVGSGGKGQRGSERGDELEGAIRSTSKGKPFFGGEEIGYLDIVLGCLSVWIKVDGEIHGVKLIDPHNTPLLLGSIASLLLLPSTNTSQTLTNFCPSLIVCARGISDKRSYNIR